MVGSAYAEILRDVEERFAEKFELAERRARKAEQHAQQEAQRLSRRS